MKCKKEFDIKYVLELSEMELATLSTVLRKANAEFISRNSEGEGYYTYETMLEEINSAVKD